MNATKIGLNTILVASALSIVACHAKSAYGALIDSEIEKALLSKNWQMVAERCGPNESLESFPVLRAIKGHACLALNRNNESLFLFLSVSNDTDQVVWKRWTSEFVQRNSTSAVAHYLKGDACARAGEWDAALESFGKSLRYDPKFSMALNARGVIYAYQKQWDAAEEDFHTACESAPSLADACASLGTLLILRRAPEGAFDFFEKALKTTPDFALALNGRACSEYALVKWEAANEDFAKAGGVLALPLFTGNLRALAVAAEHCQLPGLENSPVFRATDFLNWRALRQCTAEEDDILRIALGGVQLPESLDVSIIQRLNKVLENPGLYELVRSKIDIKAAPDRLLGLIKETDPFRAKKVADMDQAQLERIRVLNRTLLELIYPYFIVQHDQRDPGTQLTLTHGFVNQLEYKNGLSPDQIIKGQANMDYLGRPLANVLKAIPFVKALGYSFEDHINQSTMTNRMALKDNFGLELDRFRPGGVLVDLRRQYIDTGEWPVMNWFGVAYVSP